MFLTKTFNLKLASGSIENVINFAPYANVNNLKEISNIQEDFNKVIMYSQGLDEVNSDLIFENWLKNKEWFIEKTGGRLIYEIPNVSFELDSEERSKRIERFIEEEVVDESVGLYYFLRENKENFFENKVVKEYKEAHLDENDNMVAYKVPKGMKISKAMKLFIKDPVVLDKLQTKMSMILQENKISGTLCFSVHPLDYLSLSENTFNWRSCHALDGEYRAGNLSYMQDSSTIICYLRSDKKAILPNFPEDVLWNNKKWRMLLFFSDNKTAHFAGRQYPFFSKEALNIIKQQFLEPEFYCNFCTPWTNWRLRDIDQFEEPSYLNWLNEEHVAMRGRVFKITDLITDIKNPRHFNDLLYSSCYIPYYGWVKDYSIRVKEHFSIGHDVPCLYCGEEHVSTSSTMLCIDHEVKFGKCESEEFIRCEYCGEYVHINNLSLDKEDNYICQDCLDEYFIYCECCGEYVEEESSVIDPKTGKHICEECFKEKYE